MLILVIKKRHKRSRNAEHGTSAVRATISISNKVVIVNPTYENCQVIPETEHAYVNRQDVPKTECIRNRAYENTQGVAETECIRQLPK